MRTHRPRDMTIRERRFDVVSAEQLEKLTEHALPVSEGMPTRVLYRDLYLDTDDEQLQRRGISCRLRVGSDDARTLTLFVGVVGETAPPTRYEARVNSADPRAALANDVEPARRLAAIVDFRLLQTKLELQIERVERLCDRDWLGRARLHVYCDRVHVRSGTSSRAFHQVVVRSTRASEAFDRVCAELEQRAGLRPLVAGTRERAQLLLKWLQREERGLAKLSDSGVALVLSRGAQVALFRRGTVLFLPFEPGTGVGVARSLLDRCTREPLTDTRLLGKLSSIGPMPTVEVWTAELAADAQVAKEQGEVVWLRPMEALDRAPEVHPDSLAALSVAVRSGLLVDREANADPRRSIEMSGWGTGINVSAEGESAVGNPHFLNSERSILEFTARVLALAEDLRTPLLERLRYLAIVSDNLDEFFMVRVAGLKRSAIEQAEERTQDGLTPSQQLDLIALHVQSLVARQYRCYAACAAEAAAHGARIVTWSDLDVARRDQLRAHIRDELLPALTPLAMTLSPGHPFPKLKHLSLSLAVVLLDRPGTAPHFAQVELPDDAPRFAQIPGMNAVITIEELVRANLDMLYPSSVVEQAYAFRVTRGADLEIDEDRTSSLLHAVEEASRKRFEQPVVRVEVERAMPAVLRDVVLRELRREHGASVLDSDDVYEIDGPLDLGALPQLPPFASPPAGLVYPAFTGVNALPKSNDIWALVSERDRLFHHPFDSYDASVVRFFREAAEDQSVTAIKMTVYRAGEKSPIVAALVDAASRGKDVVAFVELKARFDEERNVGWAKRLEDAGGRVVHGLVGIKNHAKCALVVRREGTRLKRYVHVGTGNYNADTARRYTDLSLLTADEEITADIQDLFNELTGSSRAPQQLSRGSLISPKQLLPELLARIEREASHARSGRGGRIRMKLNGLSDPDVVSALFRASQDGVQVELVVRGVCTLRPGMTGVSENITVVSVLGRFLEHARMFYFANAGAPEYYIGSADMRPRNLRRRVELLVPIKDRACRAQLDTLFDSYLADATAWELTSAGEYVRRHGTGPSAQDTLLGLAVLTQ
jgi:polyphosphate kinase